MICSSSNVSRLLRPKAANGLLAALLYTGLMSIARADDQLDEQLTTMLANAGFTGRVESTLEQRLGRPINRDLAELGRLLWFDKITGLHSDNTCAGCHSPTNGFGDTQSIAIGIQNNNFVGANRTGPRNQRRTPMVINNAFYPKLMWNGRFSSRSGNPFDNGKGFLFPEPEGTTKFPPGAPESITCSLPKRTFRRPSRSKWPVSPAPAGSSTMVSAHLSRRPTGPVFATSRFAKRCSLD